MVTPPKAAFVLRHPENNPLPEKFEPSDLIVEYGAAAATFTPGYPDMFGAVQEFHDTYLVPRPDKPELPQQELFELRLNLIYEELLETKQAYVAGDLVEFADGVADLLYVVLGLGDVCGLPLRDIFTEVHRSNMSKLDENGKPIFREDGKVLKGPNFSPPNIKEILDGYSVDRPGISRPDSLEARDS